MPSRNGSGIALLADPTRLRIIALIAERPRRPSVIARELGLAKSTVSRQLRLLEDAGLVVRQRWLFDRRTVLFALHHRQLAPVIAWLAGTGVGGPQDAPSASPAASDSDTAG